ncbi:FAD-dependent thymidylate synthase [Thalassobacillus sp. CUG 92003]|uniref:FAD-dependent thymidylate synthase n=1 Tax=Thalassobacillus sp. CUG 92003 TaxID=2736641 RepID=UPI0015E6EEA5|nr:FAD-dependent thymidylate synthase [Thalassobacillus sp. CUG 92003]
MNVTLMAHTQLSDDFHSYLSGKLDEIDTDLQILGASDGQAVALTAIRTCYSPNKPTEVIPKEGGKYFGKQASDGGKGSDADRLFRHIVKSGHTSTLEHISFTFAIEGVSRALLAQLTRHRVGFSFSVQSQRYVKLGSENKSGGMNYVVPEKTRHKTYKPNFKSESMARLDTETSAEDIFESAMEEAQFYYDWLREAGVPPEDARAVLPNATACNLVMTANLTALLSFYAKRRKGNGAQSEIADLAESVRAAVTEVEPWTEQFFEGATQ